MLKKSMRQPTSAPAHLSRIPVSAHTLRHTFALGYRKQNPGKLVELATLLGHESLDTTAIYALPSEVSGMPCFYVWK